MIASIPLTLRERGFISAGRFRQETAAAKWEGPPWGRNLGKRSPKERSAVPGASQWRRHSSSQRGGDRDSTASAQGGGSAQSSKTEWVWGLAAGEQSPGLVVLCPKQRLSQSSNQI